jgi:hypothetical protein
MSGLIVLVIRILLSITIYIFLGWSLWLLWRDLKETSRLVAVRNVPSIGLDNGFEQLKFSISELLIGRDQACDFRLQEKAVSARHTRLTHHHGQWWIEDLNSRNGTFLNGEPVEEAMVLTTGDCVRCGPVEININIEE